MLGIFPRLFEEFLASEIGPDKVRRIRREAGLGEAHVFRDDGCYSDDAWRRLFYAASRVSDFPSEVVEGAFARYFFQESLVRWPELYARCSRTEDLLKRIPDIHSDAVSTFSSDQCEATRKLTVEDDSDALVIRYRSPNRMCEFLKAMVSRAGRHFGEEAAIEEAACTKRGDECCVLRVLLLRDEVNSDGK